MSSLEKLLGIEDRQEPSIDPFFDKYGLISNPFPPSRTIIPQVLYGQDTAVQRFASLVRAVLSPTPERRALGILGGTGGGKTHFLRHCESLLKNYGKKPRLPFVIVEFQAGSGKVTNIVREAYRGLDAICRDVDEVDLPTALIDALDKSEDSDRLVATIQQEDLRSAISRLRQASGKNFQPRDRNQEFDFDRIRDNFWQWLNGAALSQTEQKYLGVSFRINTASFAIRVLTEVMSLARALGLVQGLLLCLDEIETLFRTTVRQYQAFLQELRYLYDEALKTERGYSLLLLAASTPTGAAGLREVNYPIYQRLAFEGSARVDLQPISGVVDAKEFSVAYIKYNHQRWRDQRNKASARRPEELLSEKEIENAFRAALSSSDFEQRNKGQVNQAPLLETLHRAVEAKRQGG